MGLGSILKETVAALSFVSIEEHRLLLTIALLLVTTLLLALLPRGPRYLKQTLKSDSIQKQYDELNEYLPLGWIVRSVFRIGQVAVLGVGLVGLLHLWGYESPVWYVAELVTVYVFTPS